MNSTSETAIGAAVREEESIDLYRFFAFALGPPTQERFQWLRQPELPDVLAGLWGSLCCPGEFPGFTCTKDFEEYESTYIAVFDVGAPEPPVPLLESAHDKANPNHQVALENTSFYEVLGLTNDNRQYAPDHLLTQLEFLSAARYLGENTSDETNRQSLLHLEKDFLERHLLNWVPKALEKIKKENPPMFPEFVNLLVHFLRQRFHQLNSKANDACG